MTNLILYSLSLICLLTLNKSFCQSNCLCVLWCDINCRAWRVGYCVLRTPTRVSCHTIPRRGLITSSKSVKSNHTLIYPSWSGPGDSRCDNINHAPAGTRRPVQDRPISSDINIPDNNGDVTPQVATARHMTRHNISNVTSSYFIPHWNKESRAIILELGFIFVNNHKVGWPEYWCSSCQRRANTLYLFCILCSDQAPVSPRSQHE